MSSFFSLSKKANSLSLRISSSSYNFNFSNQMYSNKNFTYCTTDTITSKTMSSISGYSSYFEVAITTSSLGAVDPVAPFILQISGCGTAAYNSIWEVSSTRVSGSYKYFLINSTVAAGNVTTSVGTATFFTTGASAVNSSQDNIIFSENNAMDQNAGGSSLGVIFKKSGYLLLKTTLSDSKLFAIGGGGSGGSAGNSTALPSHTSNNTLLPPSQVNYPFCAMHSSGNAGFFVMPDTYTPGYRQTSIRPALIDSAGALTYGTSVGSSYTSATVPGGLFAMLCYSNFIYIGCGMNGSVTGSILMWTCNPASSYAVTYTGMQLLTAANASVIGLQVSPSGKFLIAIYFVNNVTATYAQSFSINQADGSLTAGPTATISSTVLNGTKTFFEFHKILTNKFYVPITSIVVACTLDETTGSITVDQTTTLTYGTLNARSVTTDYTGKYLFVGQYSGLRTYLLDSSGNISSTGSIYTSASYWFQYMNFCHPSKPIIITLASPGSSLYLIKTSYDTSTGTIGNYSLTTYTNATPANMSFSPGFTKAITGLRDGTQTGFPGPSQSFVFDYSSATTTYITGGGGGAGTFSISSFATLSPGFYTIVVGAGGSGIIAGASAGTASSIHTVTAAGGGYGGYPTSLAGGAAGLGGGGATGGAGGTGTIYSGATGTSGGGGAGNTGDGTVVNNGLTNLGATYGTNFSYYFGAGGINSITTTTSGFGRGMAFNGFSVNASANSGSGGAGNSSNYAGSNGGSGFAGLIISKA